ncbi:MAG: YihY/virulence factor BrkB family protein [Bacteroidetes bacterium]|nr:MAG: YihY/virulence factor BrkB family protein [Bacteroidota bacterium]
MNREDITVKFSRFSLQLLRKLIKSAPVKNLLDYTRRVALPGFDGMPIFDVADFFFTGIQRGSIVTRAQSLAFSFFLAIFPAIIFLFSLIPYIPIPNFQNEILSLIRDFLPMHAYETIRTTIEDIIKIQRGGLLSIGFLLALYFTTNGFMTMIRSFNSSYHIFESRTPWQQRKVAVVLTFILSVLVIAATAMIIFGESATRYLVAHHILKTKTQVLLLLFSRWVIVMALFFFAISFLYYYAPAVRKKYRFVSAGSTFATLLSLLVSTGFAYFVNHFNQYNKIYGSIGTLIVIMLWIYFNSLSLILGFELNASISHAKRKIRNEY